MKIQVLNIPSEGIRLAYEKTADWFSEKLKDAGPRDFSVDGIRARFKVTKLGRAVAVEGRLEARIEMTCCRCIKPFGRDFGTDFRYTYLPFEKMPREGETEITEEDVGVGYYEDVIDLAEIAVEQIVLGIPMKPLCGENCRGLCPYCGNDLNVADCGHEQKTLSSPFAVLKDYPFKKTKR